MLDTLKEFFADLTGGAKQAGRFEDDDYRLAAAALLIHAATIDGSMSPVERERLHAALKQNFNLDEAATDELIEEAAAAEREAIDLYGFTSRLDRSLDDEGRKRLVEMMWTIVFADGRATEFEENLVWRAADLLNVSSRERIALRQRAAGAAANGEGGASGEPA